MFGRNLRKGRYANIITHCSSVYLTSVLEYLCAEVIELSGYEANKAKRKRLLPRHVLLAIKSDQELKKLCKNVIFAEGGVFPKDYKKPSEIANKNEAGITETQSRMNIPTNSQNVGKSTKVVSNKPKIVDLTRLSGGELNVGSSTSRMGIQETNIQELNQGPIIEVQDVFEDAQEFLENRYNYLFGYDVQATLARNGQEIPEVDPSVANNSTNAGDTDSIVTDQSKNL